MEDEYYCTEHLQFSGCEILSGYRAPKPVSLSANLFMTYADFILTKVLYYVSTVTNSEFDCLRKLILANVTDQPVVFHGAILYLLLVILGYDWTFSIVEHRRNFTPAVNFGFLYDEELAEDVLLKLSSFTRSQLLRDSSTQLNLTTRGRWTEEKVEKVLTTEENYVGPLRWLLKTETGEKLWNQLSEVYEQVRCHGRNANELLRSPLYTELWNEILMNIAVVSDMRSEQLVKLIKNWPEVSSRNIITWWQRILFSTQENLINPLPYIPPYNEEFRPVNLFNKCAKEKLPDKPVLKMSLRDGVRNEYSRVWPLLDEKVFCMERAKLNKQRVRPKDEGVKAILRKANEWEKLELVKYEFFLCFSVVRKGATTVVFVILSC